MRTLLRQYVKVSKGYRKLVAVNALNALSCAPKWVFISRVNVTTNQSRVTIHRISRATQFQWRNLIGGSPLLPTGQSNVSIEVNIFTYQLIFEFLKNYGTH